ncbi:MAG: XRE family transcriptional regulator [Myxococcota bacterium]
MEPELERIADRIRAWRSESGLTLQALARQSGVATSTIQKVENRQMIPTVAVLLKIARGLGRRPSEFVSDEIDESEVVHLRPKDRPVIGKKGLNLERLTGDLFDPEIDVWRITMKGGQGSGAGTIRFEGEAMILCEEGEVSFRVGSDEFQLHEGDSLHFKAVLPHSWRNAGDSPARFVIIGTVPARSRGVLQRRLAAVAAQG